MSVFAEYAPYTLAGAMGRSPGGDRRPRAGRIARFAPASPMWWRSARCWTTRHRGPHRSHRRPHLPGRVPPRPDVGPAVLAATAVPGLYLCGAATHPGGSVIGLNGRERGRRRCWKTSCSVRSDRRRCAGHRPADSYGQFVRGTKALRHDELSVGIGRIASIATDRTFVLHRVTASALRRSCPRRRRLTSTWTPGPIVDDTRDLAHVATLGGRRLGPVQLVDHGAQFGSERQGSKSAPPNSGTRMFRRPLRVMTLSCLGPP